jgi:drug/metabolite transporter (DMT)-like permease
VRSLNETTLILTCVLLGAAGQIAFKVGASSPALAGVLSGGNWQGFFLRAALSPGILLGLVLYAASTLLWLLILARAELSYAYPFISIGFVVTLLYGWLALGEAVSMTRLAGVILIIAGVFAVSRS